LKHCDVISAETLGLFVNDFDDLLDQFPKPLRAHSRRVAICCAVMAEHAKSFLKYYDFSNHWYEPRGRDPGPVPAAMTAHNPCCGELDPGRIKTSLEATMHMGGTLHDIGKLFIPVKTTEADYQRHPSLGAEFLERHKTEMFSNEVQAQIVVEMVRCHHEQPDGDGFPDSLKGRFVPFVAGMCAVADRIDHRLYAKKDFFINSDNVLKDIKKKSETEFFASSVICAEQVWSQIIRHYTNWNRFAAANGDGGGI